MKFTSAFIALPLLAVQVLAVAVAPSENAVKRSTNVHEKRQFKSSIKCDTVPQCTSTCNAIVAEISKCDFLFEGTTRQGTTNIKCLCTPAFIQAAVANYNCEVPLTTSNFRAPPVPNIDQPSAQVQIDTHVAQCKLLGIDLGAQKVTADGPRLPIIP